MSNEAEFFEIRHKTLVLDRSFKPYSDDTIKEFEKIYGSIIVFKIVVRNWYETLIRCT